MSDLERPPISDGAPGADDALSSDDAPSSDGALSSDDASGASELNGAADPSGSGTDTADSAPAATEDGSRRVHRRIASALLVVLAAALVTAAAVKISGRASSVSDAEFVERVFEELMTPGVDGRAFSYGWVQSLEHLFGDVEPHVLRAGDAACGSFDAAREAGLSPEQWAARAHRAARLSLPAQLAELYVVASWHAVGLCPDHAEWWGSASWEASSNPFIPDGGFVAPSSEGMSDEDEGRAPFRRFRPDRPDRPGFSPRDGEFRPRRSPDFPPLPPTPDFRGGDHPSGFPDDGFGFPRDGEDGQRFRRGEGGSDVRGRLGDRPSAGDASPPPGS